MFFFVNLKHKNSAKVGSMRHLCTHFYFLHDLASQKRENKPIYGQIRLTELIYQYTLLSVKYFSTTSGTKY